MTAIREVHNKGVFMIAYTVSRVIFKRLFFLECGRNVLDVGYKYQYNDNRLRTHWHVVERVEVARYVRVTRTCSLREGRQ